jgi:hypothetical protein
MERLLEQPDFVFTFNSFLFTSASSVSPFSEIIPCPVQSFCKPIAQKRKQGLVRHLTARESIKHTCGKKRLNCDRDNTVEDRNRNSIAKEAQLSQVEDLTPNMEEREEVDDD